MRTRGCRVGEFSRRGAETLRNAEWTRLRLGTKAPGTTAWHADEALANVGWSDEARAASLAVRRAKAAARKKARESEEAERRQAEEAEAEKQANIAKRKAQKAREEKALARQRMFEWQRKWQGKNFIQNWFPRGRDGRGADPHYGTPTDAAPYGYVEGTREPREEPLYDRFGRAIVPRPWGDYHRPIEIFPSQKRRRDEKNREWIAKVIEARDYWGPFGKRKRFFDEHPDATEADWEAEDRRQFEEWQRRNPRP